MGRGPWVPQSRRTDQETVHDIVRGTEGTGVAVTPGRKGDSQWLVHPDNRSWMYTAATFKCGQRTTRTNPTSRHPQPRKGADRLEDGCTATATVSGRTPAPSTSPKSMAASTLTAGPCLPK